MTSMTGEALFATDAPHRAVDLPGLPEAVGAYGKRSKGPAGPFLCVSHSRPQPPGKRFAFSSAPWKSEPRRRTTGLAFPQIHSPDDGGLFFPDFPLTSYRGTHLAPISASSFPPSPSFARRTPRFALLHCMHR